MAKGGSNSSSESRTTTTHQNLNLQGFEDEAFAIIGEDNEVVLSDHGAVENAFDTFNDFYDETVDLIDSTNSKSLSVIEDALLIAKDSTSSALEFGQRASENALNIVSNMSKPSSERTTEDLIKFGGVALTVAVVAGVLKK